VTHPSGENTPGNPLPRPNISQKLLISIETIVIRPS